MSAETKTELTTVYQVKGMTCGHCEGAVSSEIDLRDLPADPHPGHRRPRPHRTPCRGQRGRHP